MVLCRCLLYSRLSPNKNRFNSLKVLCSTSAIIPNIRPLHKSICITVVSPRYRSFCLFSSLNLIRLCGLVFLVTAYQFGSSITLLDLVVNDFSFDRATSVEDEFILVCKSHVWKTFSKMDIYSGTGPDLLASRVLVEGSHELSLPLANVIRRIIAF